MERSVCTWYFSAKITVVEFVFGRFYPEIKLHIFETGQILKSLGMHIGTLVSVDVYMIDESLGITQLTAPDEGSQAAWFLDHLKLNECIKLSTESRLEG